MLVNRMTEGFFYCPSCNKKQHPLITKLDDFGTGYPVLFRCKYCGTKFNREQSKSSTIRKSNPKKREQKPVDIEARRLRQKKYNHSHKGKATQERYRENNRERLNERYRNYYAENREKIQKRHRDWHAANAHLVKRSKVKSVRKCLAEMQNDPNDKRHGTLTGYGYGCRCEACSNAQKEHMKAYYRKRKAHENQKASA